MSWQKGESGNPGGRPAQPIEVREVRRLCQEKSLRAYEIVAGLMENATKEAVQLAAALAVLKMAGVPMNAEVNITVTQQTQPPTHLPAETLEAGLGPSELN